MMYDALMQWQTQYNLRLHLHSTYSQSREGSLCLQILFSKPFAVAAPRLPEVVRAVFAILHRLLSALS